MEILLKYVIKKRKYLFYFRIIEQENRTDAAPLITQEHEKIYVINVFSLKALYMALYVKMLFNVQLCDFNVQLCVSWKCFWN